MKLDVEPTEARIVVKKQGFMSTRLRIFTMSLDVKYAQAATPSNSKNIDLGPKAATRNISSNHQSPHTVLA